MKQLKFLIFILIAITILSCYSVESNCPTCDGDVFWEHAGNLPHSDDGFSLTVANNGNIWAQSYDKLYLSTDNGDTWVKKNNNTPFYWGSITVNPNSGYLFYTGSYGVFRSNDNGENWKYIHDNLNSDAGILFTVSGEIYIGYPKSYMEDVCYYSNDNGNTWIEKSKGLPAWFSPAAVGKDGTLYAGSGVYRSTDGGATWLPPSNYNNAYVHSLAICDDGSIFAATSTLDAVIIKSTDKGVNWTKINTGFDAQHIFRVIYNPVTKDIFVTTIVQQGYYKVYRSTNLGKDWKLENSGLPNPGSSNDGYLVVNPMTGQMFMGIYNGFYRTKNYPK